MLRDHVKKGKLPGALISRDPRLPFFIYKIVCFNLWLRRSTCMHCLWLMQQKYLILDVKRCLQVLFLKLAVSYLLQRSFECGEDSSTPQSDSRSDALPRQHRRAGQDEVWRCPEIRGPGQAAPRVRCFWWGSTCREAQCCPGKHVLGSLSVMRDSLHRRTVKVMKRKALCVCSSFFLS